MHRHYVLKLVIDNKSTALYSHSRLRPSLGMEVHFVVLSVVGTRRETLRVRLEHSWRWRGVVGVVKDVAPLWFARGPSFPLLWDCVHAALEHGFHVTRRENGK